MLRRCSIGLVMGRLLRPQIKVFLLCERWVCGLGSALFVFLLACFGVCFFAFLLFILHVYLLS
jgi:hypothetical protein